MYVQFAAACLGIVATAGISSGAALGLAGDYNEFILGSSSRTNVNAQGRVAVGGSAIFNNFTVASNLGTDTTNLVVGGSLSANQATVRGSIVTGGAASYSNPTVYGNFSSNSTLTLSSYGTVNGNVRSAGLYTQGTTTVSGSYSSGATPLPIDFDAEAASLKALSLGQVEASDPTPFSQYNQLYFTGTGAANYFNVTGAQLQAATSGFHFDAPAGASIIINVSGSGFTIPNTGFTFHNGATVNHLIFNFYEATAMTLQGSTHGSFLAPLAAITTSYGGFNGNLIAGSLTGSISTQMFDNGGGPSTYYVGELRDVGPQVPEPAALGWLGVASAMLVRRRAK